MRQGPAHPLEKPQQSVHVRLRAFCSGLSLSLPFHRGGSGGWRGLRTGGWVSYPPFNEKTAWEGRHIVRSLIFCHKLDLPD